MLCPNCSRQNPDGSKFCDGCGANFAIYNPPSHNSPAENIPQQQFQPPVSNYNYTFTASIRTYGQGIGIASMILGIISLMFFWLPLTCFITAVISIVLSAVGLTNAGKIGLSNDLAVSGLVMAIVALSIRFIIFLASL